jgi:hypothetical protein
MPQSNLNSDRQTYFSHRTSIISTEFNARIYPDFWSAGCSRSQIPNPGLAALGGMCVSKPRTPTLRAERTPRSRIRNDSATRPRSMLVLSSCTHGYRNGGRV